MRHYNVSFSEWFNRIFALKASDQPDGEVLTYITPTVELLPRVNIVRNDGTTASGTRTLYQTPSDKDFYLTSISVGFSKNAACDNASGTVACGVTIDGVNRNIIQMASQTLTAEIQHITMSFAIPIKIDRSTNISIYGTFTAGAMTRCSSLTGYTVETTR